MVKLNPSSYLPLALAALISTGIALVTPPFQFVDEQAHFVRAYQVSRGDLIGHPYPQVPAALLDALLRYPPKDVAPPSPDESDADARSGLTTPGAPQNGLHAFNWGLLATQSYWSIAYLPAAAGIRFASLVNSPVVGMLYAARLMNVLFFVSAIAAALHAAPNYRALIAGVALLPMTLLQTAAVSADPVLVALSLTAFALVLRTRETPASRRYLAILLALVPILALCKYSLWVLPLLLLLPGAQFGTRTRRAAYLLSAALLTTLMIVAWSHLTGPSFEVLRRVGYYRGIDLGANASYLASHPFTVLWDVTAWPGVSHMTYWNKILHQFAGAYSWQLREVPHTFPYLALLAAVAILESPAKPLILTERLLLIAIFVGSLAATYIVLFIVNGAIAGGHAAFATSGVQGRYLLPYCLAGFLALKQRALEVNSRVLLPVVLAVGAAYGLVSLWTVAHYYR